MTRSPSRTIALLVVWFSLAARSTLAVEDWTQFRGAGGQGVAETPVPLEFGPAKNLRWKSDLPGGGGSSPVIWKDRIFLTSFTGYAVPGEGQGKLDTLKRHVLCLDRKTGKILWDKTVPTRLPEEETIREGHGYASNTPAVDGDRVYAFFGKSGVFAFDHAGNQVWQTSVGDGLNGWGSGASPVLHEDLVLINASVESESLYALNRETGDVVWRARGVKEAWNTPHLVKTEKGETEIIVPIIEQVLAFDPKTGKQLWNCRTEISWYMAPSAVSRDGVVYCIGGRPGQSLAVRAGGRGDVTETHRLWTGRTGSNVPSPILHGDYLYWIHDNLGIATCANAATGELVYEQRVGRLDGVYASPILVKDHIYFFSRDGKALVIKAGPQYQQVFTADLRDGGAFNASPAAVDGELYVRSDGWLYCFAASK